MTISYYGNNLKLKRHWHWQQASPDTPIHQAQKQRLVTPTPLPLVRRHAQIEFIFVVCYSPQDGLRFVAGVTRL